MVKSWQFHLPSQTLLVFTAKGNGDLYSPYWNPGLCSLAWPWDCLLHLYPSQFLSTTCKHGTTCSATTTAVSLHHTTCLPVSVTLPLLPTWINVASLNPWLSDFHTALFSDGSGCYLFWNLVVILSMVAWGGKACLPMPPSWPEGSVFLLNQISSIFIW